MKKIMFNDRFGLTQAVLDGRKTQTRRFGKFVTSSRCFDDVVNIEGGFDDRGRWMFTFFNIHGDIIGDVIPNYDIGELVAIAQPYSELDIDEAVGVEDFGQKMYALIYVESAGWNNKMFVKADLMKHHIKITNVRIEELQDITDEDCLAEGIEKWYYGAKATYYYHLPNQDHLEVEDLHFTPQEPYATLIDKISGKGTWERNPFVWVYEFELID